ncbi:MAG: alkaline phosphatase family protein [Candidatus Sumerlaeia bacterium]|nr:alkaline phosphatase family protein [Candidatus Sumerlaeia bacterium]
MKVIVLGLDGATLEQILPAVARGDLPAFARLMREGAWETLRSTLPAESPAAWTTFATGVGPGRHGIYGFMLRRAGSYEYDIGTSHHVRVPTLWDIAGANGLRVGVIHVPFTYPPRPVRGFLVAGMMAPDTRSKFTWPPDLRAALLRAVPNYRVSHGLGRSRGADPRAVLARDFSDTIAARERAMRWLDERYRPDLLICVFTVLDRLQHFLWADMDAGHPAHSPSAPPEYRAAIAAAYRQLDGVIARTLNAANSETLLVVLSDHGFQAVARTFFVNRYLVERGYLALTGERGEPAGWAHRAARMTRRLLARLPGGLVPAERLRARHLISAAFVRAIDWPRTRAWFGLDRVLWINVAGRDPAGCVRPGADYEALRAQLIAELESLRDPETGYRVAAKVHRGEEAFAGGGLSVVPDLLIEPARDTADPSGRYVLSERLGAAGVCGFVGPSAPVSGYHTPEGVLFLWGKGVAAGGRLTGASIADVAPTILAAFGISPPSALDGKPLLGGKRTDAASGPQPPVAPPADAAWTESERAAAEQQLKDLGYLD